MNGEFVAGREKMKAVAPPGDGLFYWGTPL